MWYRSGALIGLGCLFGWSLGCSDAAAEPPPPVPEMPDMPDPPELPVPNELPVSGSGLQLSVDGWPEAIPAKAQLNVTEGVSGVHLSITGAGAQNLFMLDVDFETIEGTMGSHRLEVGLPDTQLDTAAASLDGLPYHSQGGHIEVSLTAEGAITGSFDVTLAEDPVIVPGRPIVFVPSDEVRVMTGRFSGEWQLLCQSHLMGHMSLMIGGEYCDRLEF